jgi:ribonuclease HII
MDEIQRGESQKTCDWKTESRKILVAGLDEAGRGAVLGPLVIAGVSIDMGKVHLLKSMGVKDSKLLSPKMREKLAGKIEKAADDIVVLKVGPCKIDNYRKQGVNLNRLEAMKFAEIINFLEPDRAYIDAPDVNLGRLEGFLRKMVGGSVELVVEHKADYRYPVVGAASIIAKVERDGEIGKLKKKYGEIGPGYTSNPVTMQWLRNWLEENKDFPDGLVRKTWITSSVLKGEKEQKDLFSFFKRMVRS